MSPVAGRTCRLPRPIRGRAPVTAESVKFAMFTVDAPLLREWVERLIGTSYIGLAQLVKKIVRRRCDRLNAEIVDRLVELKSGMSRFVGA